MGISTTADQFVGKIRRVEKTLGDAGDRKSLLPVARTVEQILITSAAQAGLRRGSKIAGRPWRGVYVRNHGARELAVGYARPAHLVNYATRPHVIGARALGTRKFITRRVTAAAVGGLLGGRSSARLPGTPGRKGASALHFDGRFSAYARSPGTRGKRFFERALPRARQEGAKVMQQTVTRSLSRIFE